jgi:hypothetical protein
MTPKFPINITSSPPAERNRPKPYREPPFYIETLYIGFQPHRYSQSSGNALPMPNIARGARLVGCSNLAKVPGCTRGINHSLVMLITPPPSVRIRTSESPLYTLTFRCHIVVLLHKNSTFALRPPCAGPVCAPPSISEGLARRG